MLDWRTVVVTFSVLARIASPSVAFGSLSSSGGPAATAGSLLPAACERRQGDLYETAVLASIDKLGDRYVLTVCCGGVHQIYVRRSTTLALDAWVGKALRVRYRYADEPNPETRCIRAPCPPAIERVVDITSIDEIAGAAPEHPPLCK